MRMLEKARLRLRSLFRRGRVEDELAAELRFHLDQLTEEYVSRGMPPAEARRAAARSMGNTSRHEDECRDERQMNLWDDLRRDLRFAARTLAKSPGFTAVVVITLALGIGANAAMFSLVHGMLLRPLDYPQPDQLVTVTAEFTATAGTGQPLSTAEYHELRQMSRTLTSMGAYSLGGSAFTTGEVNLTAGDRPLRVRSVAVDAALLRTLGIRPMLGRLFTDQETWDGPAPCHRPSCSCLMSYGKRLSTAGPCPDRSC